jgi:hypothetical protein
VLFQGYIDYRVAKITADYQQSRAVNQVLMSPKNLANKDPVHYSMKKLFEKKEKIHIVYSLL